jgi:ketosteroid isomerase-like protein
MYMASYPSLISRRNMTTENEWLMSMTSKQLRALLQKNYFDAIDQRDAGHAVQAFTEDVEWSHYQVWEHHGHMRNRADVFHGRTEVREFLAGRIAEMQEEGIRHLVTHVITEGDEGAFRAKVQGTTGESMHFFGWVELTEGRISKYIVGPEP